ncbi:MAG: hypothetical protein U0V75_08600 [Ferruginibacter sp.]
MKKILTTLLPIFVFLLFTGTTTVAQKAFSVDIATVRNMHADLNGLNLSSFYHFTHHITGGIEMNRFFPVTKTTDEGKVQCSAWDFDLNFHYQFCAGHHWLLYPVTGFSHTSEKEISFEEADEGIVTRFWSYNTGAGIAWHKGKWAPHAEYLFTWGHMNQRFLLAGISYEFETGHHHKKAAAEK